MFLVLESWVDPSEMVDFFTETSIGHLKEERVQKRGMKGILTRIPSNCISVPILGFPEL